MLYAIVGALVIILDQWVKFWVADAIVYNTGIKTFIPGVISLVNIHNDGAAFSILSGGDARIYFILLTAVFTVAVIIALASRFISGRIARWSIVLVTAGGLSNCIDRMIYGYVQDMFKVELFNFAVFNVADIFITVFAIIFAIAMIFEKDQPLDDEDSVLFERDDEDEDRPSRRRKAEKDAAREAKEYNESMFAKAAREPKEMLEAEQPKRRPRADIESIEMPSRKERRAKYEEEYEQYKASRAARQQQNPAAAAAAAQQKAPAHNPADPFAEWEKANSKAAAQQANSPAAKAAGISEFSAPQPKVSAKELATPVSEPAAPAPKAAKPASTNSGDEFSLDDILNEFK